MDARERGYMGHMLKAVHWRQIPIAEIWKEISYLEMSGRMFVPERSDQDIKASTILIEFSYRFGSHQ